MHKSYIYERKGLFLHSMKKQLEPDLADTGRSVRGRELHDAKYLLQCKIITEAKNVSDKLIAVKKNKIWDTETTIRSNELLTF